jgi:4-hydroxybenzoyl-CoA reductase subunit beta
MSTLTAGLRLAQPSTIDDAVAARGQNPGSRYLAGGTDLIVKMRRQIDAPNSLIDLAGVDELTEIKASADGLSIGAGVTLAAFARDAAIAPYSAIAQATETIAGPGHRNIATVGGNLCQDTRCIYYNQSEWWRSANSFCLKHRGDICHVAPQGERCHAAYSGDLAPALMVFGAEVDIAGPKGRRRIPLGDLFVEDGRAHLALAEGELVVAVHLPAALAPSAYAKVRLRGAIDFPLAGVAVALASTGGKIGSLRIALTGTNSRPFLLAGSERFAGRAIDDKLLQEIDRLVQKQVQPMRTTTASANYRRVAAAALARRLTARLFAAATT